MKKKNFNEDAQFVDAESWMLERVKKYSGSGKQYGHCLHSVDCRLDNKATSFVDFADVCGIESHNNDRMLCLLITNSISYHRMARSQIGGLKVTRSEPGDHVSRRHT